MECAPPAGIDLPAVTAWMAGRIDGLEPPLAVDLIAGGHSNLTFRVIDATGRAWALRRPPLGHVLATAHDMAREHRIIAALAATAVPVPPVVGLCEDPAVNGALFYVMDFVEGTVVRDLAAAEQLAPAVRTTASRQLIDALADIHAVDVDAVGLGDLARRDGYIERQLKRWLRQYESVASRDLPAVTQVHGLLSARIPEPGPAGIVHGDFRLDNCILGPDGAVLAVLDWELCTLGDVMADLGQLVVYWAEPSDGRWALESPPTAAGGFATRDELVARYAERSGRDVGALDFYVAFAAWKVACIIEGVYARYRAGAMGDKDAGRDIEAFADRVEVLLGWATEAAERL